MELTTKSPRARVHRTLLLAAAVISVMALAAGAAQAVAGPFRVVGAGSNGLNERSAPSSSGALLGRLPNGAVVYIACQTAGGAYATGGSPATDAIWDQLTSGTYVADYWVSTPAVGTFSQGIARCGAPVQSPPPPPPVTGVKLENGQSARCLDADAGTIGMPGTRMQLWDCLATQANQNWLLEPDGTIRSAQSGQCLDADLNTIAQYGTIVHLWACNGGSNQHWTIEADGTIRNDYNQWCLDADGPTIRNDGTRIQLWGCNGGRNQHWTRFAPNAAVPYQCYTFSTGYQNPLLTFGLSATICYNGMVVTPAGSNWVHTQCNAAGGNCTTGSLITTGGGVEGTLSLNQTFSAAVDLSYDLGPPVVYYNPLSTISVDRNGNSTVSSTPGPGTVGG